MPLRFCRTEKKDRGEKEFKWKGEKGQVERKKDISGKRFCGKNGTLGLSHTVRNMINSRLTIFCQFLMRAWYHNGRQILQFTFFSIIYEKLTHLY